MPIYGEWGKANCIESNSEKKSFYVIIFLAIIPENETILALGGIIILLTAYLVILTALRKKKSQNKLEKDPPKLKSTSIILKMNQLPMVKMIDWK
jgi:hypothetical protein